MTAPEFTATLRRLVDPGLVCYFNPLKQKFVIDRCTNPESSSGLHACSPRCVKTNVLIVDTDDGKYRDLGEDLIAKLKSMDCWAKYGTLENMNAATEVMEQEDMAARMKAIDLVWENVAKDNKPQLRKAFHLIQQHDAFRLNK